MKPVNKKATIKAMNPEAYLYEKEKKDKKITDKDLFIMDKKREKPKKKNKKKVIYISDSDSSSDEDVIVKKKVANKVIEQPIKKIINPLVYF